MHRRLTTFVLLLTAILFGSPVQARHRHRLPGQRLAQPARLAVAPGCRLRVLGAAGMVTGSMHVLEAGGQRLLVDCGMRQGRDRRQAGDRPVPAEAASAGAMLLTHAHVDHSGDIPLLVKNGFRGKIHCTPGTAALCQALLVDSARVQERKAREQQHEARPPRYTVEEAEQALRQLEVHRVGETFAPLPGMSVQFSHAGHIVGAASALVRVNAGGRSLGVAFSGDIGRRGSLLVKDPQPPRGADYVVMESTYGDRTHAPVGDMKQQLYQTIEETRLRGGKVVIPAFSVHRTQQLIFLLNQLRSEGRMSTPVFVDSPLAGKATLVYRRERDSQSDEVRAFARSHGEPYAFPGLRMISSSAESRQLNDLRTPAVIISSAGMANAGRIQHHLANSLGDPRNTVAIVGYMSEGTPGRQLRDGSPYCHLLDRDVAVRAQVKVLSSFSGHADRNDLLSWAVGCGPQVKRFLLVHGEPNQSQGLAAALRQAGRQVTVPTANQVIELE